MEIIILFNLYMPPVIIIIHTNMYQFFLLVVKLYIEVVKLMYSGISSSSLEKNNIKIKLNDGPKPQSFTSLKAYLRQDKKKPKVS